MISKQEDLIDKDMKMEEIQKLYNEAKITIARQPKYEVHDEIRNMREELRKKNDKENNLFNGCILVNRHNL